MGVTSSHPQAEVAGDGGCGPIHISHAHNWQELNGGATPAQLVHDLLAHHGLPVSPIKRRSAGWHMLALQAEVEEARCVVAVVRDEFLDEVLRGSNQESCGLQPSSWCYSELKWAVDMGKPVVAVVWPNTRPITSELFKQLSPSIQLAFRDCTSLNWADDADGEVALRFGKRIVETLGGEYHGEVPALKQLNEAGLSHLVNMAKGELGLFSTEDVANMADEMFEDAGISLSEDDRAKLASVRQAAVDTIYQRRMNVASAKAAAEKGAQAAEKAKLSSSGRSRSSRWRRRQSSEADPENLDTTMSEGPLAGNWAGDGDAILRSYQGTPTASLDGYSDPGSANTSQRSVAWGADAFGVSLPKLLISRRSNAPSGGGSPRLRSPLGAQTSSTGDLADLLPRRRSTASTFASARSTDLESEAALSGNTSGSMTSSMSHRMSEGSFLMRADQASLNKRKASKSPSPASASTSDHSNDSVVLDMSGLGFYPNPDESPDIDSPWSDNIPDLESPFMTPISTPRAKDSADNSPFTIPQQDYDHGDRDASKAGRSPTTGSPSVAHRMLGGIFKSFSTRFGSKATEVGLPVTSPPDRSPAHSPHTGNVIEPRKLSINSKQAGSPSPSGMMVGVQGGPSGAPELENDIDTTTVSAVVSRDAKPSVSSTSMGGLDGALDCHHAQQKQEPEDAGRAGTLSSLRDKYRHPSSSTAMFSHAPTSSSPTSPSTSFLAEHQPRSSGTAANSDGWAASPPNSDSRPSPSNPNPMAGSRASSTSNSGTRATAGTPPLQRPVNSRNGKPSRTRPTLGRPGHRIDATTSIENLSSGAEEPTHRYTASPSEQKAAAHGKPTHHGSGETEQATTAPKTTRRGLGRSKESVLDGGSGQWLSGPQASDEGKSDAEVLSLHGQPWTGGDTGSGRMGAFAALQSYYSDEPCDAPPVSSATVRSGDEVAGDEVMVEDFDEEETTARVVPLPRMKSIVGDATPVETPRSPSTRDEAAAATTTVASDSTTSGKNIKPATSFGKDMLPGGIDDSTAAMATPRNMQTFSLQRSRGSTQDSPSPDSVRSSRQREMAKMDRSLEGRPVVKALIDAQLGALVEGVCWQLGVSTLQELRQLSEHDLLAIGASPQNMARLEKFLAGTSARQTDSGKLIPVDMESSVAAALELYNLSELREALEEHGVASLDDLIELSDADVLQLAENIEGAEGGSRFRKARLLKLVSQCKRQALQQIRPASGLNNTPPQTDDAPLSELVEHLDNKATVEGALRQLQGVIVSPSVREQLQQTELVKGLLRVMESKSDNGATAQTAVSVLASLVDYDQGCLSQVDDRHGLPVLVDFFSRTTNCSSGELVGTQQHALTCATRLVNELLASERADSVAASLRAAKAVPAIFGLLERMEHGSGSSWQGLQGSMLRVVFQLTSHAGLREEVVGQAGAVTTLAEVVDEPAGVSSSGASSSTSEEGATRDERIQLALKILGNLVAGPNCPEWCVDEVLNSGVLPRALAWMEQTHAKDVQAAAKTLVANLSASAEGYTTRLAAAGITPGQLNEKAAPSFSGTSMGRMT